MKAFLAFSSPEFLDTDFGRFGRERKSLACLADGATVRRVLNRLWFVGEGLQSTAQVRAVVADLIEDRSLTFRDLLDSQNEVAKKLLPAIAKAGVVAEPNSAEFLSACALSGSSVRSSLADLRERDLVYKTDSGYVVYDRLLGEWLKTRS